MTKTVKFAHSIGDTVRIKAIDCNAHVETMSVTCDGNQYRVAYWIDCKRYAEWVRGDEIEDSAS